MVFEAFKASREDECMQIPAHLQTLATVYQFKVYLHLSRWHSAVSLLKDCQNDSSRWSLSLFQRLAYNACITQAAPTECELNIHIAKAY